MNPSRTQIATGVSYGAYADDQHASRAVKNALAKIDVANGVVGSTSEAAVGAVLLFLTNGYAHQPQNAIRLAAAAAGTPAIHGACSASVFTEDDWLLDVEGAAAMVFPLDYCWQPSVLVSDSLNENHPLLCLSSPNAAKIAVASSSRSKFGSVVSDLYGHGPFSLWQSGRISEQEYCHLALLDKRRGEGVEPSNKIASYNLGRAPAVRPISNTLQINRCSGNRLQEVDQAPAMSCLINHLPANLIDLLRDKLSNILVAVGNTPGKASLESGDVTLLHVIDFDSETKEVVLSDTVKSGRHLFWAIRDRGFAQQAMKDELTSVREAMSFNPAFAFLFPNISRGAEFYAGRDRDREIFTELFPEIPMLGFYGYAEILSSGSNQRGLHYYSTLYGIFS